MVTTGDDVKETPDVTVSEDLMATGDVKVTMGKQVPDIPHAVRDGDGYILRHDIPIPCRIGIGIPVPCRTNRNTYTMSKIQNAIPTRQVPDIPHAVRDGDPRVHPHVFHRLAPLLRHGIPHPYFHLPAPHFHHPTPIFTFLPPIFTTRPLFSPS